MTIFGTRPEAIKVAPVIKKLESTKGFKNEVCITAQHREMLDQVLEMFQIKADYDLNIMETNQDLFKITTKALTGLKTVIKRSKPDVVLVQGDTTTSFIAALAAYYLKIPVGHIEAGLRTYDKYSPFPEEINRHMTSVIADFNFAPTSRAKDNLIREGVSGRKIFITGNTVVDALRYTLSLVDLTGSTALLEKRFEFLRNKKRLVLITGHRRESFGEGFKNICRAIRRLAEAFTDHDFVYPVHLNPNVRRPVQQILDSDKLPNLYLIKPLEYLPFVYLMKKAYCILTDSGGIQEEAVSFNKPVLIMRNITERPEGIEAGAVRLVGNREGNIFKECKKILLNKRSHSAKAKKKNPYGDGRAAERIVEIIGRSV
ncbi:MAG: UDP-N-acetylglucosamine 2-epimerase (non-hydrolyzing) [Candidatus Omnitrophica bacterium]|nr:UDP-N-acetylglucosamine 2-epimerase (non-hydrolyzing) [Candidatus Omnitrophota bacterium]